MKVKYFKGPSAHHSSFAFILSNKQTKSTHYILIVQTPKPPAQTNMKFLLFASIFSFAVAAAVGPVDGEVKLINRDNNNIDRDPVPYRGVLKQKEAEDIANGYLSVLQNKDYNGQPPSKNWKKYVEKKYREISGSINSLISKNNDVSSQPFLHSFGGTPKSSTLPSPLSTPSSRC
jgi:hypothetical protein